VRSRRKVYARTESPRSGSRRQLLTSSNPCRGAKPFIDLQPSTFRKTEFLSPTWGCSFTMLSKGCPPFERTAGLRIGQSCHDRSPSYSLPCNSAEPEGEPSGDSVVADPFHVRLHHLDLLGAIEPEFVSVRARWCTRVEVVDALDADLLKDVANGHWGGWCLNHAEPTGTVKVGIAVILVQQKMPTDILSLRLVELQTAATVLAALAAVAMWKATVNLVKVTRDVLLANVAPEVVISLEHPQPFPTIEKANVKIENRGSVDLIDVQVSVGCRFKSDDGSGEQRETQTHKVGKLKSGGNYRLSIWDISKNAIRKQKQLGDSYQKARDAENAPVEVHVTSRHGATGIPHTFDHRFLVEFSPDGNLLVSELFIEGDSRRIVRSEANTVSEETITPITKTVSVEKTS